MEISTTKTVATKTLLGEKNMEIMLESMYTPREGGLNVRGDDADHLIKAEKQTIGVADGVGGWDKSGVDVGEYTEQLMKIAVEDEPKGDVDPVRVLDEAYSDTDATKTLVSEKGMKMVSGSFYIPKEGGLNPQGDDAHFISYEKQTIGVADGVGGWAKSGVDAGEYARELINNSVIAIADEPEGAVDPFRVLNKAYTNTCAEGSSTACILTLTDQCLHIANIGDSGFILIRKEEVIFRSPIQQHTFNSPYQLGNKADRPSSAEVFKVEVKPGDVIVTGTDGLFDNMFNNDIKMFVQMGIEEDMDLEIVAWAIAEHTYYTSVDQEALTPYTIAANKARPAKRARRGGKKDDITVVVSNIVSSDRVEHCD